MSKELQNLEDLYLHELKDIYSAEKQITKALPKLAKAASSPELKSAFEEHLQQTEGQIQRLDKIFKRIGESASGVKCKSMAGLIEEGDELAKEEAAAEVLDAGLITAGQKVEHYEMAAYGSLCEFAELLGYQEDAELLHETLTEEEQTDEKLSSLAEEINKQAQEPEGESEEDMETSGSKRSSRK